jgi:antitoxin (DNA-binding transcriptional repressor) of toxin-antitoxin stability system
VRVAAPLSQEADMQQNDNSISIRQLGKNASTYLLEFERQGVPVTVTRMGRAIAYLVPLEYASAHLPELQTAVDDAKRSAGQGEISRDG